MNIDPSTLDAKALSNYADHAKICRRGRRQFHHEYHSDDVDRRARAKRCPPGAVLRRLFGIALALVGEPRRSHLVRRSGVEGPVSDHGSDRARRAARVLGAVAYTVGRYGVGSLKQLCRWFSFFTLA